MISCRSKVIFKYRTLLFIRFTSRSSRKTTSITASPKILSSLISFAEQRKKRQSTDPGIMLKTCFSSLSIGPSMDRRSASMISRGSKILWSPCSRWQLVTTKLLAVTTMEFSSSLTLNVLARTTWPVRSTLHDNVACLSRKKSFSKTNSVTDTNESPTVPPQLSSLRR